MSVALGLLDPSLADVRVEFGIARAEYALTAYNRSNAELHLAIDDTLGEARDHPEVFLLDRASALAPADWSDFAERAAIADLAVRLNLSEVGVRDRAADARLMRSRLPRLWYLFLDGAVAPANARCAAELARSLPDEADVLDAFDEAIAAPAAGLVPGRFRIRARVLRERVHHVTLTERAARARETRAVWLDNELDGMATLSMRMPAEEAHSAYAHIDAAARSLAGAPDEQRTLAQARADVAADLLTGTPGGAARFSIGVTVPVMTLLGASDEPATLDGYGPIDAETARRLAAHAPSFFRLLTHPVSGSLLDIDRTVYRPPADLKRWLEVNDAFCTFIGCGRRARNCDLDHTVDFQFGGKTRADNLAHLCRHHHRLKHMTGWKVEQDVDRRITWTSPTGHRRDADPPPF